jgi:hypothetical protein
MAENHDARMLLQIARTQMRRMKTLVQSEIWKWYLFLKKIKIYRVLYFLHSTELSIVLIFPQISSVL